MSDLIRQITADLQQKIDSFVQSWKFVRNSWNGVMEAGDGIARARGLDRVRSQELVQFDNGVMGIAFNLEQRVSVSSSWATTATSRRA